MFSLLITPSFQLMFSHLFNLLVILFCISLQILWVSNNGLPDLGGVLEAEAEYMDDVSP